MTSCANCGRPIPCGCPNPVRTETALTSLFGVVCDNCDGYNDPGKLTCAQCGQPLATPTAPRQAPPEPQAAIQPLLLVAEPEPAPAAAIPLTVAVAPLKLEAASEVAPLALTQVMAGEAEARGQICPRCSAHNPPDFRYCTECGMALRPGEPKPAHAVAQPVAVGKAGVRILRGDKLGQVLGIGMRATAGRASGPLSFPGDPFLAQHHCTLSFQQTRFFVRDEQSPSGTFVRLRDEEPLAPGDVFAIGDHLMRYVGLLPAEITAADGTRLLGCPRPPGTAVQLEEIHEGGVPGRISVRLGPALAIGRDDGCELSFGGDPFVSGQHCSITVGPGGRARLRDMGSTNGTFRRIEPGSERELLKGDCIRIGSEVLQIVEMNAPVLQR